MHIKYEEEGGEGELLMIFFFTFRNPIFIYFLSKNNEIFQCKTCIIDIWLARSLIKNLFFSRENQERKMEGKLQFFWFFFGRIFFPSTHKKTTTDCEVVSRREINAILADGCCYYRAQQQDMNIKYTYFSSFLSSFFLYNFNRKAHECKVFRDFCDSFSVCSQNTHKYVSSWRYFIPDLIRSSFMCYFISMLNRFDVGTTRTNKKKFECSPSCCHHSAPLSCVSTFQ